MAKTKKILKFLNKQFYEMRMNLDAFHTPTDIKSLHALRLNGKKTKAISILIKNSSNEKLSIKKLKELFDQAGEIRTGQLNVKALQENSIDNKTLIEEQNRIIEKESAELISHKKIYGKNIRKTKKNISIHSSKIKNKKIIRYYKKSLYELRANFSSLVEDEQLHDNRKIIKRLLLALNALPKSLQDEINLDKKYFDDLQDKIGNWHDSSIALDMLSITDPGYNLLAEKKQLQLDEITKMAALLVDNKALSV